MEIGKSTRPLSITSGPPANGMEYVPAPYKKIAGDLEAQFNEHMLNEMNSTVDQAEEDTPAESFYKSSLTTERAKAMASSENGVGLKKMILDQIYPERMRNEVAFNHFNNQAKSVKKYQDHSKQIEMGTGQRPAQGVSNE